MIGSASRWMVMAMETVAKAGSADSSA